MPKDQTLQNLYLSNAQRKTTIERSNELVSWDLTQKQSCDIELILNGGFSPLQGFMNQADYESVLNNKNLANDTFWPLPITLDVTEQFAADLKPDQEIALRDPEGVLIAVMQIEDIYTRHLEQERKALYNTADEDHPGVYFLSTQINNIYLGGTLQGIQSPIHHDFQRRRDTPQELRARFKKLAWNRVIGFQTRRPLHRREVNQTFRAARLAEANLLIHPAVGELTREDLYHYARVHSYEHVLKNYPAQTTELSLAPLFPRHAGVLDVLLHAILQKNSGCTHFMIDESYLNADTPGAYKCEEVEQDIKENYETRLGIELICNEKMVYSLNRGGYMPVGELKQGEQSQVISDQELRNRLNQGLDVPVWYSFSEVIAEVRKVVKPPAERGLTLFFTGLSGSGKSSVANAVLVKMMELGGRAVTLLDGDIVRQNLSAELGFSKQDRDTNIRRIGYVASEITKHGGMAICAPIAPYAATRRFVRNMISNVGGFVEVYLSTGLEECERRDRKGLYAKARAGIIKEFTGISDPYEVPENPELTLDTTGVTVDQAAQKVILTLEKLGYIK
jgi:sulfate adenylyltransferase